MLSAADLAEEQMKRQYLGDVSDYRKYALLRALTSGTSVRLGICWMLTPDDGRNDGNRLNYLDNPNRWRGLDPELFDLLKMVGAGEQERRLEEIERSGILGRATFADGFVTDDCSDRAGWLQSALAKLNNCELVFFDPDNGLEIASLPKGRKNSSKFLYLDELIPFWKQGANVLIYQHYPMIKRSEFEALTTLKLRAALPDATITLFQTPYVLFLLASHPSVSIFNERIAAVSEKWPSWFLKVASGVTDPAPLTRARLTVLNTPKMAPKTMLEFCEGETTKGWEAMSVSEALELRGRMRFRCPECHGAVKPHKPGTRGNRAHFEHLQRHFGCSSTSSYRGGPKTRHPSYIE